VARRDFRLKSSKIHLNRASSKALLEAQIMFYEVLKAPSIKSLVENFNKNDESKLFALFAIIMIRVSFVTFSLFLPGLSKH